jgi:hypothetical protein
MAQFACGKFALSQSVAREFQPMGKHAVHVGIDAILDVLRTPEGMTRQYDAGELGSTDDIADTYYALRRQSPLILSLPPSQANITGSAVNFGSISKILCGSFPSCCCHFGVPVLPSH